MAVVRKILVVIALVGTAHGLSCTSCDKTACAKPLNCKAGLVKGLCGCCDVCAKADNERCGGPWYIHGKCAEGLKCVTRTQLEKRDQFLPEYFKTGVCESADACQNITCGFRQKCKVNKRGKPICVCPRRCGKAKYPVCGLLNGKRYRNKCRLQREECLTKTEIGLITGECKKCTYKGKEFKFGATRPDAKACETCICHHGLWKCDIKPSCFLNNLPVRSEQLSCLVSQDEKTHVLPCPKGFSCRIHSSEDSHDSYRAGVCKPKPKRRKVKKPKKVSLHVEDQRDINRILERDEERLNADKYAERRMPAESEYRPETPFFTETKTTTSTTRSTSTPTIEFRNDQQPYDGLMTHVCLAYPDKRSCSTTTSIRWYYNATIRSCVQFSYGGCGGSFNNFLSIEKCRDVCHSVSHPRPTQPSPVYVSTQKRQHHESGILLNMCHDMKSGMSYRNGESWHVDACTSCSCVSGHALCVAATCPITCLNPVHIDGKCCPICQTDIDNEIIVEGENTRCKDTETELWYYSGESWNKDNCTTCVCVGGEMSCMASVCSKPLCPNPVKKDGACCPVCTDEQVAEPTKQYNNVECKDLSTGKLYLPGEGWNMNDCVSCFCGKNGQQVCHESKCSKSKCTNPVHLQGRCCPVCPEAFHSACIYDNRQYFQGDFMLLRDMCTLCKCNGNMWNCTKIHCNTTAKDMLVPPFEFKPTSLHNIKKGTTGDSGFYMNTKMTANIPTDDDSERREDYIIEDPIRMTRRDKKKPIIRKDIVKEINGGESETTKITLAMIFSTLPKTTTITSTENQSHLDTEHDNIHDKENSDNEEIPWFLEPTEKAAGGKTLPWAKGINSRMWSSWDELEYSDHDPENKTSAEVYGMKRL